MRIGLLETDVLYDDLIEDYGSYGLIFKTFFSKLNTHNTELEFTFYQVQQGELPNCFKECDAYVITGSKSGVYENHDWIKLLSNWVVEANQVDTKILGVCFGHQLIAHALGGTVTMSKKGWGIGVRTLSTATDTVLSRSLPEQLSLIYSHKDQVIKLPPDAQNFITDDFCPNAGFTIKKNIVTFQGHPEFNPIYLKRLLARRSEDIGEPTYSNGIESLSQKTDEVFVGKFILDFLHDSP